MRAHYSELVQDLGWRRILRGFLPSVRRTENGWVSVGPSLITPRCVEGESWSMWYVAHDDLGWDISGPGIS